MFADIHSHILPALDDGVSDIEEAVKVLRAAELSGTKHIVATPHYISGTLENDYNIIRQNTEDLRKISADAGLDIDIYVGAEVFISPDIPEMVEKGAIITLNYSSFILIELPMDNIPLYTDDVFFSMQIKGLTPIIAHPERNAEIRRNPGLLCSFNERGILAQANAGSITGLYGRDVRKAALKFIGMGLIQFVGSDVHSAEGRSTADLRKAEAIVRKKFGKEIARDLFYNNGIAVIENRTLVVE